MDTSIQKAGIPGFSGCLEHSSVLWQLIKEAKKGQKNVAAVWLDLANAYGSFSHKLVWSALELYIIMPGNVQERVKSLFPEEHRSGFHHILADGRENHRTCIAIFTSYPPIFLPVHYIKSSICMYSSQIMKLFLHR